MHCLARKSSLEDELQTGSGSLKRLVDLAVKHKKKTLCSIQTMKGFLLLSERNASINFRANTAFMVCACGAGKSLVLEENSL